MSNGSALVLLATFLALLLVGLVPPTTPEGLAPTLVGWPSIMVPPPGQVVVLPAVPLTPSRGWSPADGFPRDLEWDPVWALPYPPRVNGVWSVYAADGSFQGSNAGSRRRAHIAWPILAAESVWLFALGTLLSLAHQRQARRAAAEAPTHGTARVWRSRRVWPLLLAVCVLGLPLIALRLQSVYLWWLHPGISDTPPPPPPPEFLAGG